MAIKIRIPKSGTLGSPVVKAAVAIFLICCTALFAVFAFYYVRYQKIVDARMKGPIFANTAKIYAAPEVIRLGQKVDLRIITAALRRAGYSEQGSQPESKLGTYRVEGGSIRVRPGSESFHSSETTILHTTDGKVDKISGEKSSDDMDSYELEPQLVTGLFDQKERSKRRLITYDDLPKTVVDAILSIEDRRFFQHNGVNYVRLVKAALIDLRGCHDCQGASTITMQLARGFFLNREKTVRRKLAEIMIAMELEQRFSKKQILELYVNQVDMGQRGSFSIKGFGEAAQAYFGKDIKAVSLSEAALLAGVVKGPSEFSPYRHPARALERRNVVLQSMVDNNVITQAQADVAKAVPLSVQPPNADASDAPYFVDLVRDVLESNYKDQDINQQGYRIYTTLDAGLQKAAVEAVDIGMAKVDAQIQKRHAAHKKKTKSPAPEAPIVYPQVALVAIDPRTGKVLALVGGRNYGMSQLNHAVAKRPTGSVFKPFVYAAAINADLSGQNPPFTPVSMIDDSPTTFSYGDQVYAPRNYEDKYHGEVTARYALAESLNNATVKLAEMTGYSKVADLAHNAGIDSVKATPSMALGSYDATPLEMSSAYTIFANAGVRLTPTLLSSLRDASGNVVQNFNPDANRNQVLDPRVAYVITNMMESVLNMGTGYAVRQLGFTAPAAGKTGTSHDAWFAGFTSNLLCIVWVGNDDYSDLRLSGGTTAAPIWAEFMKRAIKLPQYADTRSFIPPPGVVTVQLDKATNLLSNSSCPDSFYASFLAGTEPTQTCDHSKQDQRNFFQKIFGLGENSRPNNPATVSNSAQPGAVPAATQNAQLSPSPNEADKNKKGFFGKVFGVFRGGGDEKKTTTPGGQSPAPN